jgi:hypothetical protein
MPQLRTFEIHLPQLVRGTAFEMPQRRLVAVLGMNPIVSQQNAMNGVTRQLDTRALQHHPQLARTPVGIAPPQFQHLLLEGARGSSRAVMRPAAAFRDGRHTALPITAQPLIAHRPRDPELLA